MKFLEEFQKLRESVPHPCILILRSENSDYCPYNSNSRNCYLVIGHNTDEDCFYGYWVGLSKDCTDCSFTEKSELCYECVDIKDCFDCDFCQECRNCADCEFCFDCIGCNNCLFCVNLRRKEFYIFNEKYSKEEYEKKVKEFAKLSFVEMTEEFEKFFIKQPHVFAQQFNNENFVGDHVYNCKNVYGCYDVNELEDCMYATNSLHSKDCADSNFFRVERAFVSVSQRCNTL